MTQPASNIIPARKPIPKQDEECNERNGSSPDQSTIILRLLPSAFSLNEGKEGHSGDWTLLNDASTNEVPTCLIGKLRNAALMGLQNHYDTLRQYIKYVPVEIYDFYIYAAGNSLVDTPIFFNNYVNFGLNSITLPFNRYLNTIVSLVSGIITKVTCRSELEFRNSLLDDGEIKINFSGSKTVNFAYNVAIFYEDNCKFAQRSAKSIKVKNGAFTAGKFDTDFASKNLMVFVNTFNSIFSCKEIFRSAHLQKSRRYYDFKERSCIIFTQVGVRVIEEIILCKMFAKSTRSNINLNTRSLFFNTMRFFTSGEGVFNKLLKLKTKTVAHV